jgi:hypothetical protein
MEPTFAPPEVTDYSPGPAASGSESAPTAPLGTVNLIPQHLLERITIGPTAPWIVERPADLEARKEDGVNPTYLLDSQHHAGRQESYHRHVQRLDTMKAVSQASQWRLNFDPATERLTLHGLLVRRGEQVADNAKPERLRVLQREEGLESHTLNGSLTVVVLLEDVRVGDILDISFTVHSQNRIFPNHFTQLVTIPNWTLRDFHLTVRFLTGQPMRWKSSDEKLAPAILEESGETEWSWHLDKLPSSEPEPNVPGWHIQNRWIQLTDFASWAEVVSGVIAAWREDLQNPEVLRLVESIATQAASPAARAERALTHLQDEIRYLSDNTALGGQIPTSPGALLKRGFGDCKDKSFAAAHLLRLLGIPARPVLVHTDLRQAINVFLPTPNTFNHAIVEYEVEGRRRWVDVTLPLQGGSVLSRPTAQFRLGLPLGPDVTGLEPIPTDESSDRLELREIFYFDTSGRASNLRVQVTATGREAEKWRRSLAHDGAEAFARQREAFYQQFFSGAKRVGTLEWRDDRANNELILGEAFELRDAIFPVQDGDGNGRHFVFRLRAHAIQSALGFLEAGKRRHPWATPFPCRIRHIIEIESSALPQNLLRPGQVDAKVFRFSCHGQQRPGFASITCQLQVLADHVPAADFEIHKEKVREAWAFTILMGQLPSGSSVPWKARSLENLLPRRGTPAAPSVPPPPILAIADPPRLEMAPTLSSKVARETGPLAPRREKSSHTSEPIERRGRGPVNRPNPIIAPPPLPASTPREGSPHRRHRRRRHRHQVRGVLFWIGTIIGGFVVLAMILFLMHAK